MRKRKNIKKRRTKSQNRDISPLRGGATYQPISTKFGGFIGLSRFIGLTAIITYTRYGFTFVMIFPGRHVEKRMFLYSKPTAHITLSCATALAYDNKWINFVHSHVCLHFNASADAIRPPGFSELFASTAASRPSKLTGNAKEWYIANHSYITRTSRSSLTKD